jgi:glycosyltransferase involved in cell wall biosynthesis
MHICLVTLDFPPFRSSGLTVYAEKVVQGIAARGNDVTVIAAGRPESGKTEIVDLPDNVAIVRVPVGRADWIALGWQAARYIQSCGDRFDVVHFADVHFAYAFRKPFVATGHQSFRQRLSSHHGRTYHVNRRDLIFRTVYYNAARWIAERPAARRARHIIMVSEATQREFVEHYGVPQLHTTVIYTGIDLGRFEEMPVQAEARQALNLPLDVPVLLYVGFSTPRKGVEYLGRAMNLVSPAQLVMVGKWEKHYQERFLSSVGDARSRVRIVGYVPAAQLATYFAAADVFVLPSLLEGFGIPLVEAMAAGLPIVTTTGSAACEIVGDAGVTVPPGDSVALADALSRVLTQPDLARRLVHCGLGRARSLFDERRMADDMEDVYQRVWANRLQC